MGFDEWNPSLRASDNQNGETRFEFVETFCRSTINFFLRWFRFSDGFQRIQRDHLRNWISRINPCSVSNSLSHFIRIMRFANWLTNPDSALAKVGYSVLQLDEAPHYGDHSASLSLTELIEWSSRHKAHSNLHLNSDDPNVAIMLELSSRFSLSLAPTLLTSTGAGIEAMIRSKVSAYLNFGLLAGIALVSIPHKDADEKETIRIERVPSSKADVFNHSQMSLIEKRRLTKLLLFAAGDAVFEDSPLLSGQPLSFSLSSCSIESRRCWCVDAWMRGRSNDDVRRVLNGVVLFVSFYHTIARLRSWIMHWFIRFVIRFRSDRNYETNYFLNLGSIYEYNSDLALPSFHRLRKFIQSSGRYGGSSPFLVGHYGGAGDLVGAFSRFVSYCSVFFFCRFGGVVLPKSLTGLIRVTDEIGSAPFSAVVRFSDDQFYLSRW